MRDDTKFIMCGASPFLVYREDGSQKVLSTRNFIGVGVGDMDGLLLIGFAFIEDRRESPVRLTPQWGNRMIAPLSLLDFWSHSISRYKGEFYTRSKTNQAINPSGEFVNINDLTDFLYGGSNAIGRLGNNASYRTWDGPTSFFDTRIYTGDFIISSEVFNVSALEMNHPDIYVSDSRGRFIRPDGDVLVIGYEEYSYHDGFKTLRPQKNIDIVYSNVDGLWHWGIYSTSTEPFDNDFTMSDDESNEIQLVFNYYGMTQQDIITFDDGALK